MAKQQDSYENMMSSIFDVLFAQAKAGKPPKPPKMTGLSGQSDMARALAEVAGAPAMYLKDVAFDPFTEAIDNANLIDFHVDKIGGQKKGRLRMRPSGDVAKYFSNPDKFIADLASNAKAERAWSKGNWLGKGMDFVQAYNWAKKHNKLSFKDAWNIGLSGADGPGLAGEKSAVKMIAESSAIKALRGSGDLSAAKKVSDLIHNSNTPLTSSKALEGFLKKNNVSNSNISLVMQEFGGTSRGVIGKKEFRGIASNSVKKLLQGNNPIAAKNISDLLANVNPEVFSTPTGLNAFLSRPSVKALLENNKVSSTDMKKIIHDISGNAKDLSGSQGYKGLTGHEFRSLYARSLQDRESVETDPKKILEIRKARAAVYTWDRLKGGINPTDPDYTSTKFKGALDKIDSALKGIKGNTDPKSLQYTKELQKYRKEIFDVEDELVQRRDKYAKSGQFATSFGFSKGKDFKLSQTGYRSEIKAQIATLKHNWSNVDRNDPNRSLKKREMQLEIAMLREAEQNLKTSNLFRRDWDIEIGRWSNAFGAINSEILQGGIAGMYISGNAFQMGKDYFFSPSARRDVVVKNLSGKINPKEAKELSILIPRTDVNSLFAKLNSLYYLTPGSIGKTLFYNGEYFLYRRDRNQRNALAALISGDNPLSKQFEGLTVMKAFLNKDGTLNDDAVLADWGGFMSSITGLSGSSPELIAYISKLKKANRFIAIFDKAGSIGSIIYRKIGDLGLSKRVSGLIAKGLEKSFLKKIPGMAGDGGFISLFAGGKIGVAQLIGVAIKQMLVAAGTAMGGIPGAIMEAMPQFVIDGIVNKLVVPVMKVISLIFWVLIFFFLGIFGLFITGLNSLTTEHASVLPGDAIECVDYNPNANTYPEGYEEVISIGPAPPGSTCPIKIGMPCTQGSRSCNSGYHQRNKSLDTDPGPSTVWYAPSDGEITAYTASNMCSDGKDYGGILWFQDTNGNQYRLIHVKLVGTMGSVKKDDAVAIMWNGVVKDGEGLEDSACFSAGHFHLDVMQSGAYVDAPSWYLNELGCSMYESTVVPGCPCMP